MSGSDATYLTETDPDDGTDPSPLPPQPSLPDGIAPARNAPAPSRLTDTRAAPVDEPFNIIETDDDLVPLSGQRPTEPRLNEIDAGPRSLVERQAAEHAAAEQERSQRRTPRTPAERRAATREGRDRTLQELNALRRQNEELVAWRESVEPQLAQIGPRLTEIDQGRITDQIAGFDRGIQEQQARATDARRRISEAMVSQDGEALMTALEQRDSAIMEQQRLTVQRNMLATGDPLGRTDQGGRQPIDPRTAPARQPAPQPVAPPRPLAARAQAMANEFAARHDWITTYRAPDGSTRGRDVDSDIALRLDAQVASENYDPSGLEYWDRLDELMAQYLPHRAGEPMPAVPPARGNGNGADTQPAPRRQAPAPERRGPMVPGGGGGGPQRSGNDVYLSPARKQAMQDAGIIGRDGRTVEDQTRFRRVLKQYQDFDRANGTVRQ